MTKSHFKALLELQTTARKRKSKSPRSQFYSKLMGSLAGRKGEKISQAFVDKDTEAFATAWIKVTKSLIKSASGNSKQWDKVTKAMQSAVRQIKD